MRYIPLVKKNVLFSISCLSFLLISFFSQATDFRRVEVGQTLSDFTLKDLKDNSYSLNDLKGHKSLLLFWKIPEVEVHRDYSLEELLMVQNLFTWYGNKKNFLVYAIYIPWHDDKLEDKETETILLLLQKYNLGIPIPIDRGLVLFDKVGVNALPATILLNEKGEVVFTMTSYPWSAEKQLKQVVESLLNVQESQAKYAKIASDGSPEKVEKKIVPRVMSQSIWDRGMIVIFDKYRTDKAFKNPTDVAINSKGQLFIVDTGNDLVHLFLNNGEYETSLGEKGMGGGKLVLPWGVCLDDEDRIYVADIGQHFVHIYDKYKRYLAVFGGKGTGNGHFDMPFDLDFYNDRLIIADTGNGLIQVIKNDFEFQFGRRGRKEGEFVNPTGVVVDKNGRICVVDTDNCRIQIFSPQGKFLRKFGASGSGRGEFSRPLGIGVDSKERIYVSDSGNNRLQVFDREGNFLSMYGEEGNKLNQFNLPGKIFVDTEDNVFIVDTGNNRVLALNNHLFSNY